MKAWWRRSAELLCRGRWQKRGRRFPIRWGSFFLGSGGRAFKQLVVP